MFQSNNSNGRVFLGYEMDERIQNIYYNLLLMSMYRHCKVFVMRMDIHLPQHLSQFYIMDFNHRFIEKEKNAGYDPLYISVREFSSEKKIHYHMVLFLDGNKTNNTYQHFENARTVLRNICGDYGCINECNEGHRNGILLDRFLTTYHDLCEVLCQISYIAKKDQKEDVTGKTFFYSKVDITPLGEEDITMYLQNTFPYLNIGTGTQWYSHPVSKAFLTW